MKLYTRLINEGVFIFWNPDEGNTSYKLKIKIAVGDDKIELVNLEPRKGENYYSFSGIGSGDYEIELNGFKDNRLYQTETKKIKIVSSVQKEQEQADQISARMSEMYDKLSDIGSMLFRIEGNTLGIVDGIEDLVQLTDSTRAYEFIEGIRLCQRRGY